jgi:hypothetical protein
VLVEPVQEGGAGTIESNASSLQQALMQPRLVERSGDDLESCTNLIDRAVGRAAR